MFDVDFTLYDRPARIEVEHFISRKGDPNTWMSDVDFYGEEWMDYRAFFLDNGEEVDISEKHAMDIVKEQLEEWNKY